MVMLAVPAPRAALAQDAPLSLILPTSNHALIDGEGPSFYQYTNRRFDGVRSRPWQGGKYGFVRNPRHTSSGIVYTRFHEGVDIQAVYRDRYGDPVDTVRAIDDGYVVYVNAVERHSTYGKYVVVEHWWSGSPFYSLYAHLNSVDARIGDRVFQGDRLGMLGYTGRGINRRRAHLHFEINMLLNRNFERWYDDHYRSPNRHGVFNGFNLAGIDVAELYLASREDPTLTIREFLARQEPFYSVAVSTDGPLDLLDRYALLADPTVLQASGQSDLSWIVSFTRSGVPIRVTPSTRHVDEPEVSMVSSAFVSYDYLTNGRVKGKGGRYGLSRSGRRYAELIALVGDREEIVDFERTAVRFADENAASLRTW